MHNMAEETKELNSGETRVQLGPEVHDRGRLKNNRRHSHDGLSVTWIFFAATVMFLTVFCGVKFYENLADRTSVPANVCYMDSCKQTANTLLSNMNQSVNPCENFYDFVCGNTTDSSKLISVVVKSVSLLHNLIKERISDESPEYLKKLHRMYKSCDCENEGSTIEEVKRIFNKIGGWPLLSIEKSRNDTESDWIEMSHKCRREGLHFEHFLELNVILDVLDRKNSSKKVIYLSHPKLGFEKSFLEKDIVDFRKSYKKIMMNATRKLGTSDTIEKELEEVLDFEIELAKITPLEKEENLLDAVRTTVGALESKYPSIRWLDFLSGILSPGSRLSPSEIIYIPNSSFIDNFSELMTRRKPSDRVLANYVFWRLLVDAISHDPCNDFHLPGFNASLGEYSLYSSRRMKQECTSEVIASMHLAADSLYAQSVHNNSDSATVTVMAESIRQTFAGLIRKVDWLAKETKGKILERIAQLNLLIGYPEEIFNKTKLDEFYKNLEIPEGGNYLRYTLNFHKFEWNRINANFKKPSSRFDWTMGQVTNIPAYLSTNEIPGIMMDPLFFNRDLPNYMNYGMIGSILGHEMVHALSSFGRKFDEYNNRQDVWWDSRSLEVYTNKTKCFVDKYNSYRYPEFQLDGASTLNENLADIEGLRVAYQAYLGSAKAKLDELLLPGFEGYTARQMFWIASGSNWCEENQRSLSTIANSMLSQDAHSPGRFRVLGPMSSLAEFARDFHCRAKDRMNPPGKCSLW